jgi:hypothetical protein
MPFWIVAVILHGFVIDFHDLRTCACTRTARTSRPVRRAVGVEGEIRDEKDISSINFVLNWMCWNSRKCGTR